jgi:peroxiredoxin
MRSVVSVCVAMCLMPLGLRSGRAVQTPAAGRSDLAEGSKEPSDDIRVTGTVIDAETKALLGAFKVTEGRAGGIPGIIQWIADHHTYGTNGQLQLFLKDGRAAPAIMIEAEGYLPQSSGPIIGMETNLTFALKKGIGPAGVVLMPDGKPASGATVYLTDLRDGIYVHDPSMKVDERHLQGTRDTVTDDKGAFSFKATVDDFAVLVLEDAGFAQVTVGELNHNREVKLQPWARVAGRLLVGTQAGTNETIRLAAAPLPYQYHPRPTGPLTLMLETQTDPEGRFAFERVPPLNLQVYHSPRVKNVELGAAPVSQTANFSLKPGEVKTLTLGGQGRPVTGQLVVTGYDGKIDWRAAAQRLDSILPPTAELPDRSALAREQSANIRAADSEADRKRLLAEMHASREEAIATQRSFYRTEKGREYYFQNNNHYALNINPNGGFRIEDVPGGKYWLRIDLHETAGSQRQSGPRIANLQKEFEIPASPGGRADEPFDLGKIEIPARKILKSGKLAPEFEVKTVDDKTVKLSDCAGKFVLLDFWAVWCDPCVAEMPYLKAAYAAFKDNPRFQMISLSLDPKIKAPRDYSRKNELGWTMGFLGDWSKAELPNQYGVQGIPAIFLIGPDGSILAKDLSGDQIKATIEKNLAKADAAKAP